MTEGPKLLPPPATKLSTEKLAKLLPPYAVILHNDDVHDMEYVVTSLLRCVPPLSQQRATEIMFEAHNSGRSPVIVCPLEPAELYRERLQSRGLTATIESA